MPFSGGGTGVILPVSIANGGTGQTTAAAALAALGGAATGSHTVKRGTGAGNFTFQHASLTAIDSAHLDITVTVPTGMLAIALLLMVAASGASNTLGVGIAVDGTPQQISTVSSNSAAVPTQYVSIAILAGDGNSHTFEPQGYCTAAVNAVIVNDSAVDAPLHLVLLISAS